MRRGSFSFWACSLFGSDFQLMETEALERVARRRFWGAGGASFRGPVSRVVLHFGFVSVLFVHLFAHVDARGRYGRPIWEFVGVFLKLGKEGRVMLACLRSLVCVDI